MKEWTRYTDEQNQFLIDNASKMDIDALTNAFNEKFNAEFTPKRLFSKVNYMGLHTKYKSRFTLEMDEFLKANMATHSYSELQVMLLEQFGESIASNSISEHCRKHLGAEKRNAGAQPYKLPGSCLPIGSEKIVKGRSVKVKVAQPNVWRPKTELVLGESLKNKQVIFLDGDSTNVIKENMVVVTKAVHARLAKNGWLNSDKEVILSGIKWSELLYAIRKEREET